MNSTLPYVLHYGNGKNLLKVLVDTGSSKHFFHPRFARLYHLVNKPFNVSSVGGGIKIERYSQGKFFKPNSDLIVKFYHMKKLKTFDAVWGHDTMKELKAIINVAKAKMILPNKIEIPLLQHKFQEVKKIQIRNDHLKNDEKKSLEYFFNKLPRLISTPRWKIKATIRTTDEKPVF